MPTVSLRKSGTSTPSAPTPPNPLPQVLQTPSGLAILEIQGTLNVPEPDLDAAGVSDSGTQQQNPNEFQTRIGRLVFPDYDPDKGPEDHAWMKRVYLYVGRHQRLTGEVKRLPRALALIQREQQEASERLADATATMGGATQCISQAKDDDEYDELEFVDIIHYKIIFSSRPEPVSDEGVD
ncbi:hypothetical protein AJ80_00984 [Polytolypa hystricis UAMH7299]|uniref:Sister chromatid cohesion protein Ctf8 n=1 Tax=Polytolypa hystricis (strain UAMH7299) TaxID=1447883 RepID=A0A2B7YTA7_POLH7|nr:hypothetical protein AJ80_00984 [Polytolypa hystricis UAMH7299]